MAGLPRDDSAIKKDSDGNRAGIKEEMVEYKLAGGSTLTDEDIEREAAQYEAGTWEGHLEKIRVGRPAMAGEKLVSVTVRFPESMVKAIDKTGSNRSDYIRRAVANTL